MLRRACRYQVNEAQYAASSAESSWVGGLLAGLEGALTWLRPLLTSGAHDALASLVLDRVCAQQQWPRFAQRLRRRRCFGNG